MTVTRRGLLAGMSVAVAGGVAGCLGDDESDVPAEVHWDDVPDGVDSDDIGAPTVIISFDWDEQAGTVRVRHGGGRNVPVDRVFIRGEGIGEGFDRTSIAALPEGELSPGDTFSSGAGVTVDVVDDEFRVEVVWVDEETNVPVTIDQFAVGLD